MWPTRFSIHPVQNIEMNKTESTKAMDPIQVIESAFLMRKNKNSHYSLRSFARDLGISPGQLSKLLNRKISLTRKQAARIAVVLELSKSETTAFIHHAILNAPVNAKVSKALREKTKKDVSNKLKNSLPMTNYSVERFKAISQWYHLPLLELTYLDTFKADESWIAKQLGISAIEARDAIRRLLDLGLLEKCHQKGLRKTTNHLFINSHSEPEVRKYERAMMEKGMNYLDQFSEAEKNLQLMNSITFPTSQARVPEIRAAILEFQKKILKLIQKDSFEEVYQMNCQLFPITKNRSRK